MLDPFVVGKVFGTGILLAQIGTLILLITYFIQKESPLVRFVRTHALLLVALAGLSSIIGSLTYSELVGFAPCKLCWFQRIFLYPSFIIGALAYWYKDTMALRYTLALSVIGAAISIYHYAIQLIGTSLLPCSTVGQSEACTGIFVHVFGYITIPLMALTLSLAIILVSVIGLRHKNS